MFTSVSALGINKRYIYSPVCKVLRHMRNLRHTSVRSMILDLTYEGDFRRATDAKSPTLNDDICNVIIALCVRERQLVRWPGGSGHYAMMEGVIKGCVTHKAPTPRPGFTGPVTLRNHVLRAGYGAPSLLAQRAQRRTGSAGVAFLALV